MKSFVFVCTMFALNALGQNFTNPDLEGTVNMSSTPNGWFSVSHSDPNCQATNNMSASPDITGVQGPVAVIGVSGIPQSGNSFVSGLISESNAIHHQEGIRQTVNGFVIGKSYTLNFYQAVVKQNNHLDTSGSWQVFLDDQLIGTSYPSTSALAFDNNNLIWEERSMQFMATSSSHMLKFLPFDDDSDITSPNESLRMGIDNIQLTPDSSHVYHDTICAGEMATIWASGAHQYHWTAYDDHNHILGYDSVLHVYPDSTSHYWCINNLDTNLVTVTVLHPPSLDLGENHLVCPGESVLIIPDVHNANSHHWSDGSSGYTYETDLSGMHWMIAQNQCGEAADSTWIFWDSISSIDLGFDTSLCSTQSLDLDVFYSDAHYSWNDGSTDPTMQTSATGDYWVEISNNCGSSLHEFHLVFHECHGALEMPNVFSPNNDGVNDFFLPVHYEHLEEYTLVILNRWGQTVFTSDKPTNGWNGKIRNENASKSVYFWKVTYTDINGSKVKMDGSLTLVR